MSSVNVLAQYLLKLDPQKSVARMTFYHFLKNFCEMGEQISPQMISQFYRRALGFQYWQTHQEILSQTVEQDLALFGEQMGLAFDPREIRYSYQIVELKNNKDSEALLLGHVQEKLRPGERLKMIKLEDNRFAILKLLISGMLEVDIFTSTAVIDGPKLLPLEPLTSLKYSASLELVPYTTQLIETAPMTTSRFQLYENSIQGSTLRGYSLQKYESLQGGALAQHSELFFALKRLERLYVQAESDPFYQELIALLEKSYNTLSQGHPDAAKLAETAIAKGQQALKSAFPNDKLLLLLVTNIEFLLSQKGRRIDGASRSNTYSYKT